MTVPAATRREMVAAFEDGLAEFTAAATAPTADLPGLPARPSPTELARVEARNRMRLMAAREAVYATAVPRAQAADLLGVGSNQVTNLLATRDLVALDGAEGQRLPAWQFDLDARMVRIAGIRQVVDVFPAGILGLTQWMTTPNPTLGGATPSDRLAAGVVPLDGQVEGGVDRLGRCGVGIHDGGSWSALWSLWQPGSLAPRETAPRHQSDGSGGFVSLPPIASNQRFLAV